MVSKARELFLAIRLFYFGDYFYYHSAYITSFGGYYGKENCLGNRFDS